MEGKMWIITNKRMISLTIFAGAITLAGCLGEEPSQEADSQRGLESSGVDETKASTDDANEVIPPDDTLAPSADPNAGHWYAVPRTGGGNPGYANIRSTPGGAPLQTVYAPNGAWCWYQETNCGGYVTGPSYACFSGSPTYTDWLPVAASSGKKAYVARHCVIATFK
jgi:hypothetical protein